MLNVAQVTCDVFPIVRVVPPAGTVVTPDQCRAATFSSAAAPNGADRVGVLREASWRRRFGADPSVLLRTAHLDRRTFRVSAMMPNAVHAAIPGADVFIALELDQSLPYDQRYTAAFGRLAPGTSVTEAQSDLATMAAALAGKRPQINRDWGAEVVPLQDITPAGTPPDPAHAAHHSRPAAPDCHRQRCDALFGAGDRTRSRAGIAPRAWRLAIGASRGRIVRQGLIEASLVATVGGILGTLGALLAIRRLRDAWADLPRATERTLDGAMLAVALVATLPSGAVAGLAPALRQARGNPIDSMRHGGRLAGERRSGRLRDGMLASQLALTSVLLTGAGLLARSVGGPRTADSGFDSNDVMVAPVFPDSEGYRNGAAVRAYDAPLFDRLRAFPGVAAVGGSTTLPTSNPGPDFARPMWPIEHAGDESAVREAAVRIVTPGYVEAMRIRMSAGRASDEGDGPAGRRVVAVSESLADRAWPNQNAFGKQLVVDDASAGTCPYEAVGVIGDVRFGGPRTAPLEEVYFPRAQRWYLILNVAVRARTGVTLTPDAVLRVLHEVDPQLPPHGVHRRTNPVGATYQRERRAMQLLMAFAAAAILQSALGIGGMVAYRVREQRREIGVRLALGSSPARVVGWLATALGRVLLVGGLAGLADLAAAAIGTQLHHGPSVRDRPTRPDDVHRRGGIARPTRRGRGCDTGLRGDASGPRSRHRAKDEVARLSCPPRLVVPASGSVRAHSAASHREYVPVSPLRALLSNGYMSHVNSQQEPMTPSREVVQGTLDLLVLSSLRAAAMHGWGIAQRIRERSGETVLVTTGALYPALHRLEQRRLVKAQWQRSENNRRAKYYALTAAGHRALADEQEWWERFVLGVAGVLAPA